jgi:hypothetical protein
LGIRVAHFVAAGAAGIGDDPRCHPESPKDGERSPTAKICDYHPESPKDDEGSPIGR